MVWGLIAAAIYAGYQLDERRHSQIRAQLAERKVINLHKSMDRE
jgi:Na+/melibiose symporter-like transporter